MAELTYSFRTGIFPTERSFWLRPDTLVVADGEGETRIPYGEIREMRLASRSRLSGSAMPRCILCLRDGSRIAIEGVSCCGFARQEERPGYPAFVQGLMRQVRRHNPEALIFSGMSAARSRARIMRLRGLIRRAWSLARRSDGAHHKPGRIPPGLLSR